MAPSPQLDDFYDYKKLGKTQFSELFFQENIGFRILFKT